MKKRNLVLTVTIALTLLPTFLFNTFAQKGPVTIESAGSGSGAGLSSGMIGITAGQSARLSVWNSGDKAVAVRLLFIDGDGKVLILCNNVVPSGQSFSDDFKYPGGADRLELRGEIRLVDQEGQGGADILKPSVEGLDVVTPSLQVIDDTTSETTVVLGPGDFRTVKPGK